MRVFEHLDSNCGGWTRGAGISISDSPVKIDLTGLVGLGTSRNTNVEDPLCVAIRVKHRVRFSGVEATPTILEGPTFTSERILLTLDDEGLELVNLYLLTWITLVDCQIDGRVLKNGCKMRSLAHGNFKML